MQCSVTAPAFVTFRTECLPEHVNHGSRRRLITYKAVMANQIKKVLPTVSLPVLLEMFLPVEWTSTRGTSEVLKQKIVCERERDTDFEMPVFVHTVNAPLDLRIYYFLAVETDFTLEVEASRTEVIGFQCPRIAVQRLFALGTVEMVSMEWLFVMHQKVDFLHWLLAFRAVVDLLFRFRSIARMTQKLT